MRRFQVTPTSQLGPYLPRQGTVVEAPDVDALAEALWRLARAHRPSLPEGRPRRPMLSVEVDVTAGHGYGVIRIEDDEPDPVAVFTIEELR